MGAKNFFTKYPPCYLQVVQPRQVLKLNSTKAALNIFGYAVGDHLHTTVLKQRDMLACVHRVAASLNLNVPPQVHVYVLAVPGSQKSMARMDHFNRQSSKLNYTGAHAIQQIHAVDSSKFYPSHDGVEALMKWGNWSIESLQHLKQDANRMIFEDFNSDIRADSVSSPEYPDKYVDASKNHLHPWQIASALSHRRFWMKAAVLPDHVWGVVFEDDAAPLGSPSKLVKILQDADAYGFRDNSNILYLGGDCRNGSSWGSSSWSEDFFKDARGYALKPAMARRLLHNAKGDIPVDQAIKQVVRKGM